MSDKKFVINSELNTKATAALNREVKEDLKQEDKPMASLLKKQAEENSKE